MEAPANEERAASAQQHADGPEAQVVARRDERRHHRVAVEHVAQDQVIDVALVAGQQDERRVTGGLAHALEPFFVEHDAVVHLRPHPGEEPMQQVDDEEALLRAEVLELLSGDVLGLRVGDPLFLGVALDVAAHPRASQELVLNAGRGLLHRAEDHGAVALHASKQRVADLVAASASSRSGFFSRKSFRLNGSPSGALHPGSSARTGRTHAPGRATARGRTTGREGSGSPSPACLLHTKVCGTKRIGCVEVRCFATSALDQVDLELAAAARLGSQASAGV